MASQIYSSQTMAPSLHQPNSQCSQFTAKAWVFQHTTSLPYHPQSNGKAEFLVSSWDINVRLSSLLLVPSYGHNTQQKKKHMHFLGRNSDSSTTTTNSQNHSRLLAMEKLCTWNCQDRKCGALAPAWDKLVLSVTRWKLESLYTGITAVTTHCRRERARVFTNNHSGSTSTTASLV